MASEEAIRLASLRSYSNHPSNKPLQFQKLRISYRGLTRSSNIKEKALVKLPARPMRHRQSRSSSRLIMLISIFRKAATSQRCLELILQCNIHTIQTSALDLDPIVITRIKRLSHHCNPMVVKNYSRRQMVHI